MATGIEYVKGEITTISHVATGTLAAGQTVVIDRNLAITRNAATSGDTVQCAITGVWLLPKVSGAVIKAGEEVLWDVSAATATGEVDDNAATVAAGDLDGFGYAIEGAGNGETTVKVALTPNTATIGS